MYVAAADASLRGYPLLVVAPRGLGTPNCAYVGNVSAGVNVVTLFGSTRQVASSVLTDAVKQAGGRSYK